MEESTDKTHKDRELTPKQKLFCENYVSKEFFGNGVQSYIDAYEIDLSEPNAYNSACVGAHDNLIKPNILGYINSMLDSAGLNDAFVDKQLLFLINQNAEFSAKISAIKEYNKLKQRITDKVKQEVEVSIVPLIIEPVKPVDESK